MLPVRDSPQEHPTPDSSVREPGKESADAALSDRGWLGAHTKRSGFDVGRPAASRRNRNTGGSRSLAVTQSDFAWHGGWMESGDREREEIIALIRADRPIPARYRATLFEDALQAELIWQGKTSEIERAVLPFQSIEHIDEPRSGTVQEPDLFSFDQGSGRQSSGWTNKLIWGDNSLILSSLANGPMRDEIESAGGLKLVYIDPPFDVGADFTIDVEVGGSPISKDRSVVEEFVYRDTWGAGVDSYSQMIFMRLRLIHNLLSSSGSIYVHVDYRVSSHVKLILDEIFGSENHQGTIIWRLDTGAKGRKSWSNQHNDILCYSKSSDFEFNPESEHLREPFSDISQAMHFKKVDADGRRYRERVINGKSYIYYADEGRLVGTVWSDLSSMAANSPILGESVGYPTQKPEKLLTRILEASSSEGDLVADFFCGSGTTLAVAERTGRRWLGVDLSRFAVHTTRKRLISVQRELAAQGKPYRAFEICNLGAYERQYFSGIDTSLSADQRQIDMESRREDFVCLILEAYGSQRTEQLPEFQGSKGATAVAIGPIEGPVTEEVVNRLIEAALAAGLTRIDILGFEFEMGITPLLADNARARGVTLTLRYIPNEVFQKRLVAAGQVRFHDVGYVEVEARVENGRSLIVELKDFGVFYADEDAAAVAVGLRSGKSRVVVDSGQLVRISKDSKGNLNRKVLTQSWSDWIDYWSVDFDFESQREILRVVEDGEMKSVWTGRYIFENEWQDFRTRGDRSLRLSSEPHTYGTSGDYRVGVKVVDVFGNDTTKAITVKVT